MEKCTFFDDFFIRAFKLAANREKQVFTGWPSETQDGLVRPGLMEKYTFVDDFFIRALKLAANREKQVFTFFAFLPPYIGVSGLPVYLKR